MNNWRALVDEALSENDRNDRHTSPDIGPSVPNVPSVLAPRPLDPVRALKLWHSKLSPLDDGMGPDGGKTWWGQAVRDSHWIYTNFASQAVRDGWSAADLFGILPWHPGWGGLTCRLRGARDLKMAGPKAVWSRFGVRNWTCQGAGDDLVSSGLLPIWELQ